MEADAVRENIQRMHAGRTDFLPCVIVRDENGSRHVHGVRLCGIAEVRGYPDPTSKVFHVRVFCDCEIEDL